MNSEASGTITRRNCFYSAKLLYWKLLVSETKVRLPPLITLPPLPLFSPSPSPELLSITPPNITSWTVTTGRVFVIHEHLLARTTHTTPTMDLTPRRPTNLPTLRWPRHLQGIHPSPLCPGNTFTIFPVLLPLPT